MEMILGFLIVVSAAAVVCGVVLIGLWTLDRWLGPTFSVRGGVEVRLTDTPSDLEDEQSSKPKQAKCPKPIKGDGRRWTAVAENGMVIHNDIVVGGTPPDLE